MPGKLLGPPTADENGKETTPFLLPKEYTDVEELRTLYTPDERPRYMPLPFFDITSDLKHQLSMHGLDVIKTTISTVPGCLGEHDKEYVSEYGEDHNYGREDMQMFCFFDVKYADGLFQHSDILTYRYGVLASHDGTRGTWLVGGGQVHACFNGMVWGNEYNAKLNHFGTFTDIYKEMQDMFREGITIINKKHQVMDQSISMMIDSPMDDVNAHDVIMKSARAKAISPSKVLQVDDHWKMNNEEGNLFKDRNAWSLYNAFTSSYKSQRVTSAFDGNRKLNRVFSKEFDLPLAA